MQGDTVVITAPFWLGLSEKDAGWFLPKLAERSAIVTVSGDLDTLRRVASAQNVQHVRVAKAKASPQPR
ncbi:hypothetical protein [Alloyangia pacifica]|uniref:hypothetical protein n=1 Tax=Alloyangia pacifica TaxID=311180 RepID=UPI0031D162E2